MRLIDRLRALPENRTLVLAPSGLLSRDEVVAAPAQIERLTGSKIAICVADAGVALRVLTSLDGIAE